MSARPTRPGRALARLALVPSVVAAAVVAAPAASPPSGPALPPPRRLPPRRPRAGGPPPPPPPPPPRPRRTSRARPGPDHPGDARLGRDRQRTRDRGAQRHGDLQRAGPGGGL